MQDCRAVCCGGGRWRPCDYVFGRVSVHGKPPTPIPPPIAKADQSNSGVTEDGGFRTPISKERGLWNVPLFLSVLSTFFLSLFYHFISEQCFLSVLPLISLLCSHSLITLFSLCGKCQFGWGCYLHEKWRTKATDSFWFFLTCLIFRKAAGDCTDGQSLVFIKITCKIQSSILTLFDFTNKTYRVLEAPLVLEGFLSLVVLW